MGLSTENAARRGRYGSTNRTCESGHRISHARPTNRARKVSFGPQSLRGARTREVLMTVLYTLRKQTDDPVAAFRSFLDQLAANPQADPFTPLFDKPMSTPRN